MALTDPLAFISSALAPVVSLSVCALLASNAQTQFSALVDRLRALNAERMGYHAVLEPTEFQAARIKSLDHQIPVFAQRTRHLRDAMFCLFTGMMFILMTSFIIISTAAFDDVWWLSRLSKASFCLGLMFIFFAIVRLLNEVFLTYRVVRYELNIFDR